MAADELLRSKLNADFFADIVAELPDDWLVPDGNELTPADRRAGYRQFFERRLAAAEGFVAEAVEAHAKLF